MVAARYRIRGQDAVGINWRVGDTGSEIASRCALGLSRVSFRPAFSFNLFAFVLSRLRRGTAETPGSRCCSLTAWAAAISGVFKTVGRIKTMSFRAVLAVRTAVNRLPNIGMSIRNGTPERLVDLVRTDEPAKHDGVAVSHGDFGGKRAFVRVGHIAHPGYLGVAVDVVDFLVDIHHHQTVGIDEGRDVQFHTHRQLRIRGTITVGAAVSAPGDIRHGFTDKELRGFRLRGLDARALDDAWRGRPPPPPVTPPPSVGPILPK